MHRWLWQRNVAAKLGLVGELAHAETGRPRQPTEVGQCRDATYPRFWIGLVPDAVPCIGQ